MTHRVAHPLHLTGLIGLEQELWAPLGLDQIRQNLLERPVHRSVRPPLNGPRDLCAFLEEVLQIRSAHGARLPFGEELGDLLR